MQQMKWKIETMMTRRWWAIWPVAVLLGLTMIFFSGVLSGERFFLLRDTVFDFVNWRVVWAETVTGGEFPFWDQVGTGKPSLGDPWNAVLYPTNLLWLWLSPATAINWQNLLHAFLTGLAVYTSLRQFSLRQGVSLLAAVGCMFSTWWVAYMEFTTPAYVVPWVFFSIAVLARLMREQESSSVCSSLAAVFRHRMLLAGLAVAFALAFLANFFEFFIYGFMAYGTLIVSVGVVRRDWRLAMALALFTGAAGLVAILLVMPELGTILQFLPESTRSEGGFLDNRFWMTSLSPTHLLGSVFPMLGGRPGFPDVFWAKGTYEFWVGTFYTGALAVLALPFAWLGWKPGPDGKSFRLPVAWGVALIVIGLVFAFGENTPVYPWVWEHVPMMNKFRTAGKFLLLVIIGEVTLTAVGLHCALTVSQRAEDERQQVTRLLWAEGVVVGLLGLLALWIWQNPPLMKDLFGNGAAQIRDSQLEAVLPQLGWSWLFLALAFGWLWLAVTRPVRWVMASGVVLVFVNLLVISHGILPMAPSGLLQKKPQAAEQFANGQHRIYSPYSEVQQFFYGDERVDIYEWGREAGAGSVWNTYRGLRLFHQNGGAFKKFGVLRSGALSSDARVANNFLDIASVRWVVSGAPWQQILWGNANRELRVDERGTALSRFSLYTAWQPVANDDAALKYLVNADNGLLHNAPAIEETALFNGREIRLPLPLSLRVAPAADAPSSGGAALTLMREGNSRLEFSISGDTLQLLVVGDTWYPGWRAFIDGAEVPIYRANYMFRAIFIPAGGHAVRLEYWPNNFGGYLAAVALGMIIVSGLLFSHWWARRTARRIAHDRPRPM
jgi:hypothetical protein